MDNNSTYQELIKVKNSERKNRRSGKQFGENDLFKLAKFNGNALTKGPSNPDWLFLQIGLAAPTITRYTQYTIFL